MNKALAVMLELFLFPNLFPNFSGLTTPPGEEVVAVQTLLLLTEERLKTEKNNWEKVSHYIHVNSVCRGHPYPSCLSPKHECIF